MWKKNYNPNIGNPCSAKYMLDRRIIKKWYHKFRSRDKSGVIGTFGLLRRATQLSLTSNWIELAYGRQIQIYGTTKMVFMRGSWPDPQATHNERGQEDNESKYLEFNTNHLATTKTQERLHPCQKVGKNREKVFLSWKSHMNDLTIAWKICRYSSRVPHSGTYMCNI